MNTWISWFRNERGQDQAYPGSWPIESDSDSAPGSVYGFNTTNHPHTAESTVSAKQTFRVHYTGPDPAPDRALVRVHATGSAQWDYDGDGTLSFGLNEELQPTRGAVYVDHTCWRNVPMSGRTGTIEFTIEGNAHGDISTSVGGGVTVQIDTKTVSAVYSRMTYRKGPDGNRLGNFLLDPQNVRADTAVPDEELGFDMNSYEVQDRANADYWGNFPNPFHTWTYRRGTASDDLFHEFTWVEDTFLYSPAQVENMADAPKVATYDLSVRDDDASGRTFTSKLKVYHHAPYEGWREHDRTDPYWDSQTITTEAPNVAYEGGVVFCNWEDYGLLWKCINKVGGWVSLSADYGNLPPIWKSALKIVPVAVNEWGPKPNRQGASFDACWGQEGSTYSPTPDATHTKSQYRMHTRLEKEYYGLRTAADAYDADGYSGRAYSDHKIFNHGIRFRGDFEYMGIQP